MFIAIWASNEEGIIGDGEQLLWDVPEDLRFFKTTTQGSPVIMGRRTWDSLPIKPLPGRTNLILSKTLKEPPPGAELVTSLENDNFTHPEKTYYIIGGGEIYNLFLPITSIIIRTVVKKPVPLLTPGESNSYVYAPEITEEFELVEENGWFLSEKEQLEYKHQMFARR